MEDDNGDIWIICSPNKTYASARYTDFMKRGIRDEAIRELTTKDERSYEKALRVARRHHNLLVFAGSR